MFPGRAHPCAPQPSPLPSPTTPPALATAQAGHFTNTEETKDAEAKVREGKIPMQLCLPDLWSFDFSL